MTPNDKKTVELKPKVIREKDDFNNEYKFTLVIPYSFAESVKNWKFSMALEFITMLAEPDDFIE